MSKNVLGNCCTFIDSFSIQYKKETDKNKYPGYKYYVNEVKPDEPIPKKKWLKLYSDFIKIHDR